MERMGGQTGVRSKRGMFFPCDRPGFTDLERMRGANRTYEKRDLKKTVFNSMGGRSVGGPGTGGGGGAGSGYSRIQEEGVDLPQRPKLNVVGAAATASDDNVNLVTLLEFAAVLDDLAALTLVNGDIFYVGSGAITNLPIATDGDQLTLVAGLPAWVTPSAGGVTWENFWSDATTVQNITAGQFTDGARTTFTLAHTPIAGTLMLFRNGSHQRKNALLDYTLAANVITIISNGAPLAAEEISGTYGR